MALLKQTLDDIHEVIGPLRDFYEKGPDGKFHLSMEGDPPKLAEFRSRNIDLMKTNEALKAQAEVDKAKLAELLAKPDNSKQATELEAQLAAERSAHSATQLKHLVTTEFLRSGGRASAVDFMAAEASKVFAMEDGKVTSKEFSATNPAEPLSIEEFMLKQSRTADWLFLPSNGGGARPSSTKFGARSNQKVLKNPTPQQLGANASAIAKGEVKVEYSE